MKLSKSQLLCLNKMIVDEPYSAYDLQVSLSTLNSLEKMGLVKSRRGGLGSLFSPRMGIIFRKLGIITPEYCAHCESDRVSE